MFKFFYIKLQIMKKQIHDYNKTLNSSIQDTNLKMKQINDNIDNQCSTSLNNLLVNDFEHIKYIDLNFILTGKIIPNTSLNNTSILNDIKQNFNEFQSIIDKISNNNIFFYIYDFSSLSFYNDIDALKKINNFFLKYKNYLDSNIIINEQELNELEELLSNEHRIHKDNYILKMNDTISLIENNYQKELSYKYEKHELNKEYSNLEQEIIDIFKSLKITADKDGLNNIKRRLETRINYNEFKKSINELLKLEQSKGLTSINTKLDIKLQNIRELEDKIKVLEIDCKELNEKKIKNMMNRKATFKLLCNTKNNLLLNDEEPVNKDDNKEYNKEYKEDKENNFDEREILNDKVQELKNLKKKLNSLQIIYNNTERRKDLKEINIEKVKDDINNKYPETYDLYVKYNKIKYNTDQLLKIKEKYIIFEKKLSSITSSYSSIINDFINYINNLSRISCNENKNFCDDEIENNINIEHQNKNIYIILLSKVRILHFYSKIIDTDCIQNINDILYTKYMKENTHFNDIKNTIYNNECIRIQNYNNNIKRKCFESIKNDINNYNSLIKTKNFIDNLKSKVNNLEESINQDCKLLV